MAIQMTREEYKRLYGVDPVVASSTLDTKPAPIRMTRAEYESLYGEKAPQEKTLGSRLADRVSSTFSQAFEKPAYPGQTVVHGLGQVAGAIGDVAGEALSPVISKLYDKENGKAPNLSPEFVERRDKAVETATTAFKGFEEKNPNAGQFVRDVTNIGTLLPFGKPASTATQKIAPVLDERVIAKRAEDLAKLEGKYAKTRKANQFADDAGEASRRRIAETDVLVNAVDENGLLRTKNPGGPIDQYKAQTIDGVEDIVRKNLEQSKDVVDLPTVKTFMTREIMNSGLDGADLVRAIKGIDDEIAGLLVRTKGNNIIDLTYLQDAKIGTTRNINYMTPPETSTYRKAIARAYKNLIEDKSSVKIEVDGKLFGVKDVNAKLAEFYKDIRRLENLDGTRVEGGKLGKYLAQGLGTAVGMGAGSVGGAAGSVVGGLAGGELAAFLKGKAMAGTFGRATGKTAPKSALLERAKLKIPDAKVMAPKNITKTKEITSLEDDIAKNVDAQKKAIAKGDFTLVAALKEIYTTLVEALKKEIARVREMAKGQGERGFANFFDDGQRVRNSNQSQAITPPTKAQNISSTVPPKATPSTPLSTLEAEAKGGFEGAKAPFKGNAFQDELPSKTKPAIVKEIINTGGNPLYHDTNASSVMGILDSGEIRTSQAPFSQIAGQGKRVSTTRNFNNYSRYSKSPYRLIIDETKTGQKAIPDNKTEFESVFNQNVPLRSVRAIGIDITNPALLSDMNSGTMTKVIEKAKELGIKIEPFEGKILPDEYSNKEIQLLTKNKFNEVFNATPNPLYTEASAKLPDGTPKYKSAEEFVKAQPVVYHGSGVPLKKFNNKQGTFFTDDMMNADGYAGGENVYEGYLNLKNPLVIDAKGALHRELDTKWGKTTQEVVGNVDKTKYDGVIFKNIKDSWIDDAEYDTPSTIYYAFKPADAFLNESQLTDIWKKANGQ